MSSEYTNREPRLDLTIRRDATLPATHSVQYRVGEHIPHYQVSAIRSSETSIFRSVPQIKTPSSPRAQERAQAGVGTFRLPSTSHAGREGIPLLLLVLRTTDTSCACHARIIHQKLSHHSSFPSFGWLGRWSAALPMPAAHRPRLYYYHCHYRLQCYHTCSVLRSTYHLRNGALTVGAFFRKRPRLTTRPTIARRRRRHPSP